MAQMTITERIRIEELLELGSSIPSIAEMLERPAQTITNEIRKRRTDSDKGAQDAPSNCVHFFDCTRTNVCNTNCGMRKQCRHCDSCFDMCPDYEVAPCRKLLKPPFVCNGCLNQGQCRLPKKYYIAKLAQADRESKLRDSRAHVQATDEQTSEMNPIMTNGLKRGQSIRHIIASNPDAFNGIKQRTVYSYVNLRCFDVVRADLPYACSRKPRKKKPVTKTHAKCRVGRTHDLFIIWKHERPGVLVPECDTVKGTIGGCVLFTIQFPCRFMLAFHKQHETEQTWTGIVNKLHRIAGKKLFQQLFPAILADNGAPFLNPEAVENGRLENRPNKLVPRTKVFYCDPYCATQKPHVERNHEELRRILPKGCCFNSLDQDKVNLAMSHVNSYTRGSLNDSTPYDEFIATYGPGVRKFLDALGIVKVPASEVMLKPELMGEKFKRHAERVMLKRHGAVGKPAIPNESK